MESSVPFLPDMVLPISFTLQAGDKGGLVTAPSLCMYDTGTHL